MLPCCSPTGRRVRRNGQRWQVNAIAAALAGVGFPRRAFRIRLHAGAVRQGIAKATAKGGVATRGNTLRAPPSTPWRCPARSSSAASRWAAGVASDDRRPLACGGPASPGCCASATRSIRPPSRQQLRTRASGNARYPLPDLPGAPATVSAQAEEGLYLYPVEPDRALFWLEDGDHDLKPAPQGDGALPTPTISTPRPGPRATGPVGSWPNAGTWRRMQTIPAAVPAAQTGALFLSLAA